MKNVSTEYKIYNNNRNSETLYFQATIPEKEGFLLAAKINQSYDGSKPKDKDQATFKNGYWT